MPRVIFVSTALLVLGALAMLVPSDDSHAADKPAQVLRHVVLYKFKDDLKPQQVQEVVDTFAALPKKVDTIIGFEHGLNVSQEGKSDGLTHAFVVTFRNEQDLKKYLDHPAHLDYVNVVKSRREKVVVFDYWVDAK